MENFDTFDRLLKRRDSAIGKFSSLKGHEASKERRDKYGNDKIGSLRMAGEIFGKAGGFGRLGFGYLYDPWGPDNDYESMESLFESTPSAGDYLYENSANFSE